LTASGAHGLVSLNFDDRRAAVHPLPCSTQFQSQEVGLALLHLHSPQLQYQDKGHPLLTSVPFNFDNRKRAVPSTARVPLTPTVVFQLVSRETLLIVFLRSTCTYCLPIQYNYDPFAGLHITEML
jgi:hypothetical protein